MADGVTEEYILLELCERYSIDPLRMDEIPDEIKIAMMAKYYLDLEYKVQQQETVKNNTV